MQVVILKQNNVRMKRYLSLLILFVFTSLNGFSQSYVNYDRDSRWYLGLNSGITWTSRTEVDYRIRGGYGAVLGYSFGMKPDKVFNWDLRARFLHGWAVGQDSRRYLLNTTTLNGLDYYGDNLNEYQDSLGFFVANHRTEFIRGSLELTLNTNRLRQRTGWNLYLLGGIGITGYHVSADLFEGAAGSNQIYDYTQENFEGTPTATNYYFEQDNDFETDLVGSSDNLKVDWMPSFGAGISYQVTPYFALGLEYKHTWTRNNDFDGMVNDIDGTPASLNDRYHYFSGTMKFHLFGGEREIIEEPIVETPVTDINNFDNTDNSVNTPPPAQKPIVDIYNPSVSPYSTDYNHYTINALVHYVDGRGNITFKQNGIVNSNFTYNANTDQFASNVILQPGQNLFEITATNDAGMDYETTIIIYEQEDVPNPPIVTINNPPYTPYTTNNSVFPFKATVLNVDSKSQIQVYFNGVNLNSFSYNTSTDILNTTLTLMEGTNTITVSATNADGSDSKTAQIIYRRPQQQQPPIVSYIFPSVDPYTTSESDINIIASVLNVASKGNITVKVNGNNISAFNYNSSSKQVTFNTPLISGANIVEIKGVNAVGQDIESTTIIYRKPQVIAPPKVTFINPNVDPLVVYESTYNVTAKVENVAAKENITLKINGVVSTYFTYSTASQLMNFTTNLVEGSNVIEIKGVNAAGEDIESTTIIYKKPQPMLPPVVSINYPVADNYVFTIPNITVNATVLNVSSASNINVTVNGVHTTGFTYNTSTKVVTLPVTLNEGSNNVTITGTNIAGTDSKSRIIIYKKNTVPTPPTVAFTNPATSPHSVSSELFTVTANTTNIDSKDQITFKMNGVLIPGSSYSFTASHQIIYNANLNPGNNIFEVLVNNPDGSASDLAIINYEEDTEPCIIPTIGYVSPVPFSIVDEAGVTIDAQINNYSAGTTIELQLNGVSKGFMSYNSGTSIASLPLTLVEGSNSIRIIVTNPCGTNQSTFTLNYVPEEAPCVAPSLSASGELIFTTDSETTLITAIASNVPSSENISILNNGSGVPFTYDAATGTINIASLALNVGLNNLIIAAATECGTATLNYQITREVCNPPVISALSHTNGTEVETNPISFSANITNATADNIDFVVNGISTPFTYNAATNTFTASLNLSVGMNTIVLTANTPCGTATKKLSIKRNIPCEPLTYTLISPSAITSASPESTTSISLHTTGIDVASNVTVKVNGSSKTFTFDPVTGNITVTGVALVDGSNSVVITMKNDCSSEILTYTISYDGCIAPSMSISGISDGMTIEGNTLAITGTISNIVDASGISLLVNGTAQDFTFIPGTAVFNAEILLNYGSNTVVLTANGCETISNSYTVTANEPCTEVSVSPISPSSATVTSTESVYNISLTALGITNSEMINVTLNGTAVPFTFNPATHVLSINGLNLMDGPNVVNVSLANACSSTELQYSITYNGCEAPIISINPYDSESSTSSFAFTANISNIESGSDVSVTLNGAPITATYNAATGLLTGEVTLSEGTNTIVITAIGCETNSNSLSVNYSIPCDPITYSLIRPTSLTASSAEPVYNIMLYVMNVTAADLGVKVNGVDHPFTYQAEINRLMISGASLNPSSNTIEITASNGCSEETITYNIDYSDCTTPTITLTDAATTSETVSYSFAATVTEIDSESNIQVKLNGTIVPFTFDPVSGNVTATVSLSAGMNNIRIIANGCETYESFFDVNFEVPCTEVGYSMIAPATTSAVSDEDHINISLSVTEVSSAADITVTLNGASIPFAFADGTIIINDISLITGENSISVTFGNDCSSETVNYSVSYNPCSPPSIVINNTELSVTSPSFSMSATVLGVMAASQVTVSLNGVSIPFEYNAATHEVDAMLTLNEGSNILVISAEGCETSTATYTLIYETPCSPVSYSLGAPTGLVQTVTTGSYSINLSASNTSMSGINVSNNGVTIPFTYAGSTINISSITLSEGLNTIVVTIANDCSSETITYLVTYTPPVEGPCGPRFNPGNSSEEFCLITPSGTFTRDDLHDNPSFTYSGPASAVYFKAIAGGGSATVGGSPFAITPGKYYLFEGTMTVTVSTSNPGSMGHWSICVDAASVPTFGVGGSKPDSPCITDDRAGSGGDNDRDVVTPTPIITLTSPRTSSVNVKTSSFMVKMKVDNVNSKSDIKMTVNGTNFSGFTFNSTTKQLVGVVTLKQGANIITINAKNGDKTASSTITINYTPETTPQNGRNTQGSGTGTSGGRETNGTGTKTNTSSGGRDNNSSGTKTNNESGTSGGRQTNNNTGTKTNTSGTKTNTSGTKTNTGTSGGRETNSNGTKTETETGGRRGG